MTMQCPHKNTTKIDESTKRDKVRLIGGNKIPGDVRQPNENEIAESKNEQPVWIKYCTLSSARFPH